MKLNGAKIGNKVRFVDSYDGKEHKGTLAFMSFRSYYVTYGFNENSINYPKEVHLIP